MAVRMAAVRVRKVTQGRKSTGVLLAVATLIWLTHDVSAATILRPAADTVKPADAVNAHNCAHRHRLRSATRKLLAGSYNAWSVQGQTVQGLDLQGVGMQGLDLQGIHPNGMTPNGIHSNGIAPNGIALSGLSLNESTIESTLSNVTAGTTSNATTSVNGTALSSNATMNSTGAGSSSGGSIGAVPGEYLINSALLPAVNGSSNSSALLREFIKYAVQCALPPTTTIAVPWVDDQGVSHLDLNRGGLGLAPTWQTGPLNLTGELWVSACLAAHTNYYRAHVQISVRGGIAALQSNTPKAEIDAFSYQEGAFWGNLFTDPPTLFACYNSTNVHHSRGLLRDCAAGHMDESSGAVVDCGIIKVLGSCDAVCGRPEAQDMHYGRCRSGNGTLYNEVVTVYLQ